MVKKIMILMLSCSTLQGVYYSDDEQKKALENLAKKVLYLQDSEKNHYVILDEILTEIAAQVDDSEVDLDKKQSNKRVIAGGIIVIVLALGIGGYLLYNYLMKRQKEIRNQEQAPLQRMQELHSLQTEEVNHMEEHLHVLRDRLDWRQVQLRQERQRDQQRGDEYFNQQRAHLELQRAYTERLIEQRRHHFQAREGELRRIQEMTSIIE